MYKNIFETKVDNYDWSTVKCTDKNVYFNNFCKTQDKIYSESFSLKINYVSKNHLSKKWIITEIMQLIKAKSDYFHL